MKSGKHREKTIDEVASYRYKIGESPDSKLSRTAQVDRVPGKPRIVTHQEWLYQQRVSKGIFFGKIKSADEYSFKILGDKKLKDYEMKESILGGSETKMIRLDKILGKKELNIMEELKVILSEFKAEELTFYLDNSGANFSFNFPKNSKYNCFSGFIVQLISGSFLKFNGIFYKSQAYTWILEAKDTEEGYDFKSNTPVDWNYFKKVLNLEKPLQNLQETINFLKIEKKSVEFDLTKSSNLEQVLDLIKDIYNELFMI